MRNLPPVPETTLPLNTSSNSLTIAIPKLAGLGQLFESIFLVCVQWGVASAHSTSDGKNMGGIVQPKGTKGSLKWIQHIGLFFPFQTFPIYIPFLTISNYFYLEIVCIPNYNIFMNGQNEYNELIRLTFRVINKFQAVEKIAQRFGTEEELYPREIHTIQAIGRYPGINITDLASRLGITKGTISPIVTKLAIKRFVSKSKGLENNKEVILRLTPKGEVAYHAHEMIEQQIHSKLFEILEKASSGNLNFLREFLNVSENIIDEHLKEIS